MGKKLAKAAGIVALTFSMSLGGLVLPASAATTRDPLKVLSSQPTGTNTDGQGWNGPRYTETRPRDCTETRTGRQVPCPQSMPSRPHR